MEQPDCKALWTTFMHESAPIPSIPQILNLYSNIPDMRPSIEEYFRSEGARMDDLDIAELALIMQVIQNPGICQNAFNAFRMLDHDVPMDILITICIETSDSRIATQIFDAIQQRCSRAVYFLIDTNVPTETLLIEKCIEATLALTAIAAHCKHELVARGAMDLLAKIFSARARIEDDDFANKIEIILANMASIAHCDSIRTHASLLLEEVYEHLSPQTIFVIMLNSSDLDEAIGGYNYMKMLKVRLSDESLANGAIFAINEQLANLLLTELIQRQTCKSSIFADIAKQSHHHSVAQCAAEAVALSAESSCNELACILPILKDAKLLSHVEKRINRHPDTFTARLLKQFGVEQNTEPPKKALYFIQ